MPEPSSSSTLTVVDDSDPLLGVLAEVPPAPDGLLELLAGVPDPRKRRGIRHGLAGVLAVALSAVGAGAKAVRGAAEWGARAGPAGAVRVRITRTAPPAPTIP